jgi:hypothetical protein
MEVCWATSRDNFSMSWTEHEGRPCGAEAARIRHNVREQMAERSLGRTVDLDHAPSDQTWAPGAQRTEVSVAGRVYGLADHDLQLAAAYRLVARCVRSSVCRSADAIARRVGYATGTMLRT